jgi:hypothetical protein
MSESRPSFGAREIAGLAGVLLLGCCVALAVLHLHDLSGNPTPHLAGIWMALAAYLRDGVFYPPLEADGFYAGTRYMPGLFVLIAGLARLLGDYLLAAKLSALLSTGLLLLAVFAVVRRMTGRVVDGVALAALVLAFPEGLSALLAPHADALPVALTLAGLLLLERYTRSASEESDPSKPQAAERPARAPGAGALAALLFAMAVGVKFSAVAGPAAAAVALWQAGRKRLAGLVTGLVALLAGVEILGIQWASDGRFLDNFRNLGSGGMSLESIRIGPGRLGFALFQLSPFLLVWPVALFLLLRRARAGTLSLWEWYLLATLGTTIVIFTSPGTGLNHLLELQVACVLVLGRSLAGRLAPILVAVVLVFGVWRLVGPPDPAAILPADLLAAVPAGEKLLCEDASVAVLRGERPVVMDPFAFRVLAERGRIDDEPLAERLRRQEFDALVMLGRIDRPGESLCPRFHFGPRVTEAMQRGYQFKRQVGGYYVFRPFPSALARSSNSPGQ